VVMATGEEIIFPQHEVLTTHARTAAIEAPVKGEYAIAA